MTHTLSKNFGATSLLHYKQLAANLFQQKLQDLKINFLGLTLTSLGCTEKEIDSTKK